MSQITVVQCKVCNSKFRGLIEELHRQGMNPQKIYDYLQSLSDPMEKMEVKKEDIKPSSIRRHLDKHYNSTDDTKIKVAETKKKIDSSREKYQQGIQITVDKVNAIAHLIETAMIRIEEVENLPGDKSKHQFTIQYMNTIKGLIESLAKLTGELKQEGTIDINFFSGEITRFADIVLSTIRQIDKDMNLHNQLEYGFANEFKKQWELYQIRQGKILSGELPTNDGEKQRNVNTFNDSSTLL